MKKLKDLTKEQVIEIAKLVYPFEDWIKSDITVRYQPYDKTWLDDAQEYYLAKFDAITFGDKVDTFILFIYPNLNLEFFAIRDKVENMTEQQKYELGTKSYVSLGEFPIRNQHRIHKKLIEWNITEN